MNQGTRQRIFLTAEWKHLVMLNYAVDSTLLEEYVPAGTRLDHFEGKTYVSLIGFEFNNTRMFGRAVPFHRSFEEVNLRFYVRRESRRGVVFIRELVPKIAVTAVARFVYGERYACVPMSHTFRSTADQINAEFSWGLDAGRCSISLETSDAWYTPSQNSLSQFITEHYWGYASRRGSTVEYQVEHPQWQVKKAAAAKFSGDAKRYYEAGFAAVLARPPDSAFLAEGSAVNVFKGTTIT